MPVKFEVEGHAVERRAVAAIAEHDALVEAGDGEVGDGDVVGAYRDADAGRVVIGGGRLQPDVERAGNAVVGQERALKNRAGSAVDGQPLDVDDEILLVGAGADLDPVVGIGRVDRFLDRDEGPDQSVVLVVELDRKDRAQSQGGIGELEDLDAVERVRAFVAIAGDVVGDRLEADQVAARIELADDGVIGEVAGIDRRILAGAAVDIVIAEAAGDDVVAAEAVDRSRRRRCRSAPRRNRDSRTRRGRDRGRTGPGCVGPVPLRCSRC